MGTVAKVKTERLFFSGQARGNECEGIYGQVLSYECDVKSSGF